MESIRAIAEGEGVGPVEAMRFFTESPAWSDYVRHNDAALIDDALNLEAICQSIQYVLRSGQLTGEFATRIGVTEADAERLLIAWPVVDHRSDDSIACL